jgi:hypothetical protein
MKHAVLLIFTLFVIHPLIPLAKEAQNPVHIFGSTDSIEQIDAHIVYYITKERTALPDWKERIEYLMQRTEKFHAREFTGQSTLNYTIYPKPFIAQATHPELPKDPNDINAFYWHIMNEVWHSGEIKFAENQLHIIIVLSDINFSDGYDDWTRECDGENCPFPAPHAQCRGHVNGNGEDRPGSRAGGSRSLYWVDRHIGLGLVTADGWRVPLKGSDCVVYHEGLGHALGLPHPTPINNSVMGFAQYVDSIQKAWIDEDQKLAMGWKKEAINQDCLFSTFSVTHAPTDPSSLDGVTIKASFPSRFALASITADYQTDLWAPFQSLGSANLLEGVDTTHALWTVDPIAKGKSVAYRVKITTRNGETEEIWHYFKIRK